MVDFTAALIQLSGGHDFTSLKPLLEEAVSKGAQLIVLPELHEHAYFCQTESPEHFDKACLIPSDATHPYADFAKAHQIVLVCSFFEKTQDSHFFNTAAVFDTDGRLAGTYRKTHIPHDPGYWEQYYFESSTEGFMPIQTTLGSLGVLVCFDQWFPEAARSMVLNGADVLIYPTAIGFEPADSAEEQQRQLDAWCTLQRGHAIANAVPVLACNRVGFEAYPEDSDKGIQFWGHSFACGLQGEWLARARSDKPNVLITHINTQHRESYLNTWTFLRDRKPDRYGALV